MKSINTILLLGLCCCNAHNKMDDNHVQEPQRPNFVILLADDLGIGDVGCFGNDTIKTPNIDKIAREGAKLTHHLAAAAVCTPSRAALLTGRYPVRQGMESKGINKVLIFLASEGGLPRNETTFAKILQEQNYRTALIGKWHLGLYCKTKNDACHHPLTHGFDYYYGLPLSNMKDFGDDGNSVTTTYVPQIKNIMVSIIVVGFSVAFWIFQKKRIKTAVISFITLVILPIFVLLIFTNFKLLNSVLMKNYEVIEQPIVLNGLTQRFVREATSFITRQSSAPFLLMLSFAHVHTALFSAPEFVNKSLHGRYGDNVEELDWAVGEVLKSLEVNNLKSNTFVYFSSDNGGHLEEIGLKGQREGGYNGKFKGGKCMGGMEGGIRVPTVAMWPGHISPGLEINFHTSQMDLFPTILDIVNSKPSSTVTIDGKSMMSALKGQTKNSPHKLLLHYCGTTLHAVRYLDDQNVLWKVHFYSPKWLPGTYRCEYVCHCFGKHVKMHDPPLIFNLSEDPYEDDSLNMTQDPKLIKLMVTIRKEISKHESSLELVPSQFTFLNSLWKPWLQPCCNFPRCNCLEKDLTKSK